MREENAREKWCPMVRHTTGLNGENEPACNRIGGCAILPDEHWNKCIASDCMMWVEDKSTDAHTLITSVCGGHCGLVK